MFLNLEDKKYDEVLIESDWNLKDERIWVQGEGAAQY